jgi:transmembrane sensor
MIANHRMSEAADWLMTLRHEEMTPERTAEWLEWGQANPENLEAFERAEALSLSLAALERSRKQALLARLAPSAVRKHRQRAPLFIYALAATLAALAVGVMYFFLQQRAPFAATYVTGKAQNRTFDLPDGSRVAMGAGTELDIAYSRGARTVALRDGEAHFTVAHKSRWPFTVRAGTLHVADIGTSFDVRKSGGHVVVTVTEGLVDVHDVTADAAQPRKPLRLKAGERVTADAALKKPLRSTMDAGAVASWRPGRLDFQDEPLSVVIANVNRYARHELVIVDPAISEMRFTGTVFHDHVDDWLAGTLHLFDLKAEPAADGRVLLYSKR